jgi:hypothetical protein
MEVRRERVRSREREVHDRWKNRPVATDPIDAGLAALAQRFVQARQSRVSMMQAHEHEKDHAAGDADAPCSDCRRRAANDERDRDSRGNENQETRPADASGGPRGAVPGDRVLIGAREVVVDDPGVRVIGRGLNSHVHGSLTDRERLGLAERRGVRLLECL